MKSHIKALHLLIRGCRRHPAFMWYHRFFVLSFLIAVLLADFVTAAVHWDEMWVKHTWNTVPANWESMGNPAAGALIDLHIALIPDRESALVEALSEISNPRHPRYGAYLSMEQVAELVSPPLDTVDLVRAWLVHHDIRPSSISITHGGSWLTVTGVLVSQANQLLGASYQLFRNLKTNDTIIGTVSYALPAVLHARIRTVAPTTYFPFTLGKRQTTRGRPFGRAQTQAQAAPGNVVTARNVPGITPSVLRWLYGTTGYRPRAVDRNKLGILGIDDDYPSQDDLTNFMNRYRPEGADATFTIVQWNDGGYNPRRPGDGANVGVQYATAIAYPTPVIFYSIGGDTAWGPAGRPIAGDMFREWLKNLLRESDIPQTISISYGISELDLPPQYVYSLCHLLAQLAGRGVTVLVASGKDGVGAGDCEDADGNVDFLPEFPSVCNYVTSVGGTIRTRPEMAANLSGGGFSFYNEGEEDYERTAVGRYLERFSELYEDYFDPEGRGYPDISAQAQDYQFIVNGEMDFMDGTTCSVSTAAGIVSLLNDYLISHNKRPLGLLNPTLYLLSNEGLEGINDVTSGSNPGCATPGFNATPGWDPVTGVGTINFRKFLLYLKAREQIPDDPVEDTEP